VLLCAVRGSDRSHSGVCSRREWRYSVQDTDLYINEFDAYALEAAITLKTRIRPRLRSDRRPVRAQDPLHRPWPKGSIKFKDRRRDPPPRTDRQQFNPSTQRIWPQSSWSVPGQDWMGGKWGSICPALKTGVAYAVMEIRELTETLFASRQRLEEEEKAEVRFETGLRFSVSSQDSTSEYLSR